MCSMYRLLPLKRPMLMLDMTMSPAPARSNWRAASGSGAHLAAGVGAVLLATGALWLAAQQHGWDTAWLDLAQYHTRDGLAAYGSHWHYHGLSTVWFGAAVGLAPAVLSRWAGAPVLLPNRRWQRIAWGYVFVLTIFFGVSADMFTDVRYAGHQAREILTHGLVTLPLGLAALAAARLRARDSVPTAEPGRASWAWALLVVGLPALLAVVALSGDVMAAGQSDQGLAAMVAAHNFEHTLDFLFIALLLLAGVGAVTRSAT